MTTLYGAGQGPVLEKKSIPTARISADPEIGIVGSVIKLDGRVSTDPDDAQLQYTWTFAQAPIGSLVRQEDFRRLDEDGSLVSFSPDRVGEYIVGLSVFNGLYSSATTVRVSIRSILVPDGRGLVPDGKFIWSYIRDVWQGVENREMFEALWSVLIQTCGAELLKTYEADFNKSIRDIQNQSQKRWLCYEPKLELNSDDLTFYLGKESAGRDASTETLGLSGKAIILSSTDVVLVEGAVIPDAVSPFEILHSKGATNIGKWGLRGSNPSRTGYKLDSILPDPTADIILQNIRPEFEFQSRTWLLGVAPSKDYALQMSRYPAPIDQLSTLFKAGSGMGDDVRRGDVIHIPDGVNQGFYRITKVTGAFIEVDHPAPMASVSTDEATVYRPVDFRLQPVGRLGVNGLVVPSASGEDMLGLLPGRVITVGGRTVSILRTYEDLKQGYPLIVITTDQGDIIPEQVGLSWRIPCTLESSSQNFEELGVSSGDLLLADIIKVDSASTYEMKAQVTGVVGRKLGFVLTVEPLTAGVPYTMQQQLFVDFCVRNNITHADISRNGALSLSSGAKKLWDFITGVGFTSEYYNKPITVGTPVVSPVGTFNVIPKSITRNSLVPLDALVQSIPTLQEWIVQPQITERDGKVFQVRGEMEFELPRKPSVLIENNDFTIDGETAFDTTLTFMTGSDVLELDGISFLDRRTAAGDVIKIHDIATYAETSFRITHVLSQSKVKVSPPIARYVGDGIVTSRVTMTRRRGGTFIRIVPGGFTPKNPAPSRYWAEVSYIDNSEAIEANFGLMVGLTRNDMEKISSKLDYRQAVAGLMFAFTRGSAVEKVRLGAQILLGLPFAEHRGVIRSIEKDYRLDSKGTPIQGRILVEDVYANDEPAGTQRIYLFPIDPVSAELSGIEVSPTTGKEYVVGDIVEAFSPLAKGVQILDYVNDPLEPGGVSKRYLQQFHSYRMKANDSIFDIEEVGLVSSFLRRITPSYVSFFLTNLTEVIDQVQVTDAISLRFPLAIGGLSDIAGLGLSTAPFFDEINYNRIGEIFWGDGIFLRRVSGQSATATFGSNVVAIPQAELTFVAEEDVLIILSGPNKGKYVISAVGTGALTLDLAGAALASDTSPYYVGRKLTGLLREGMVSVVVPDTVAPIPVPLSWAPTSIVEVEDGLHLVGVMSGDWLLVVSGGSCTRFVITKVEDSSHLRVLAPTVPIGAYRIVRPELWPNPGPDLFALTSDGAQYTDIDEMFYGLADPFDDLVMEDEGLPRLFIMEPKSLDLRPILPAGQYLCRLSKREGQPGPIGFDLLSRQMFRDEVALTLHPATNLSCTNGSMSVDLGAQYEELGPRLGDFIKFTSLNQVDNGYGVGVFPITGLPLSSTSVALSFPLIDTGSSTWAFIRRS
jgi:hypothetical protein